MNDSDAYVALSLAWGGRFREAMSKFSLLPEREISTVELRYQFLRCCIELGEPRGNIRDTGSDAYNQLLKSVQLRVDGREREAISVALDAYDQIFVPDADREILECLYRLQTNSSTFGCPDQVVERPSQFGRIFQFWDSAIPADVERLTKAWQNTGLEYQLFNNRSAYLYLATKLGQVYADVFARCSHPAMKADYFRLAYLAKEGGIYADADEELIGDFEMYVKDLKITSSSLVCTYAHERVANNNFLIASSFHPVIMRCLQLSTENIMLHPDYPIWRATGPAVLGMSIAWCVKTFGIEQTLSTVKLDRSIWDLTIRKAETLEYKSDERDWRSTL